jgi:hypothetical protein
MVEATATKSMLESEGIDAFVHGEHHRAQLGFFGPHVDLRVMVRASQLPDARELLEEAEYAEHLPPDEPAPAIDDASVQRWREHAGEEPQPSADDDLERRPARPRSLGIPIGLGLVVGLGTGHLYGGRFALGAALGIAQLLVGAYVPSPWMWVALVALRLVDALGGARAIAEHNRTTARPQA